MTPNREAPEDQSGADHGSHRLVGLILGGAGVLAAGTGLTFGLLAQTAGEHDRTQPVYSSSAETVGRREQLLQYVGYGVGAALVAAGVTTFMLGRGKSGGEAGASVSLMPWFSPGSNSASGANGALASIRGRL